jgi:hypothetical protein
MRRMGLKLASGLVLAVVLGSTAAATLSQSFPASQPLPAGTLVALNTKTGKVEQANVNNVDQLYGVVVPTVTVGSASTTPAGQVQVTNSGVADVFVTNAAGTVHFGDYLTASPVAGVAQLAGAQNVRVIGVAQAGFDGTGNGVSSQALSEGGGKNRQVAIGQIPVAVNTTNYTPTAGRAPYAVPNWIQSLANAAVGKAVSPLRVLVAVLVLIFGLLSITVLLYSAIRSSLISIGRNPLSKTSILRGLAQVVGIAAAILVASAAAVFVILAV